MTLHIRPASAGDGDALWHIIEPIIRAGETNALPRDMSRADALAYWCQPDASVFVAEIGDQVAGTYFLRPNQQGGGAHVANAGYMTATAFTGRGVARGLCEHSLIHARRRGFRAVQFNFVISTNEAAVHLWTSCGFATIGRTPGAFLHPHLGYVDALIMHRAL